jgi:hypothetical protein
MPMSLPSPVTRLGFHYYPDTFHYRVHDLDTWLPELNRIGTSWITLLAPAERAIPEFFINGLLAANIQPVLHFQIPIHQSLSNESFRLLFSNYARWGVRYVALCDRPNVRTNWLSSSWAQTDLVERFLDYYLPLAGVALQEGLTPVFPPLEPGGDYWDLAFLKTALRAIQRRGNERLLEVMVLGAYAWTRKRPLDWGVGGPERWPEAHPYLTPPECQDHLGFRIFDWYLAVSQQELGKRLPIILLRAGSLPEDHAKIEGAVVEGTGHAQANLALARLLSGKTDDITGVEPVPPEVLACNFWLLAAHERSVYATQAWFQSGSNNLPVVDAFRQWISSLQKEQSVSEAIASSTGQIEQGIENLVAESDEPLPGNVVFSGVDPRSVENAELPCLPSTDLDGITELDLASDAVMQSEAGENTEEHPISHYVLLPLYAWGIANWDLALIQPMLEESHPTVGFSLAEARLAERVTVVGGEGAITPETLDMLRASGCKVERVLEDGTLVAT